jgi:hypothetical protein
MNPRFYLLSLVGLHLSLIGARAGWVPLQALDSPAAANGNRFGVHLQMEGSTLIAGEQGASSGVKSRVGAVASFERNAAGAWQQTQYLTYPDEPEQAGIGRTIALSGDTLMVSVITATAGRVLVYQRSASGAQWGLVQTLTGDAQDEYFGNALIHQHAPCRSRDDGNHQGVSR